MSGAEEGAKEHDRSTESSLTIPSASVAMARNAAFDKSIELVVTHVGQLSCTVAFTFLEESSVLQISTCLPQWAPLSYLAELRAMSMSLSE